MSDQQTQKAKRKLLKLYKNYKEDKDADELGILAAPDQNDLFTWNCIIQGPKDTIWDEGYFHIVIKFTKDYPKEPPTAEFQPSIFHPNVYKDGRLCLDILTKKHWSKEYSMAHILISIRSLLNDPNPESPANHEANEAYLRYMKDKTDTEYPERVRKDVEESWNNLKD